MAALPSPFANQLLAKIPGIQRRFGTLPKDTHSMNVCGQHLSESEYDELDARTLAVSAVIEWTGRLAHAGNDAFDEIWHDELRHHDSLNIWCDIPPRLIGCDAPSFLHRFVRHNRLTRKPGSVPLASSAAVVGAVIGQDRCGS
jgi:hypothetical protein